TAGPGAYSSVFLTFTPDGKHLFTRGRDQVVHLFETATGKKVRTFGAIAVAGRQLMFAGASGVALSPDGKQLVVAGQEVKNNKVVGFARVWEVATGKELRQLKGLQDGLLGHLAFSPDGKLLVFGHFDGSINLWDAEKDQQARQLGKGLGFRNWSSLTFSPD